jgi:hypothetical protein
MDPRIPRLRRKLATIPFQPLCSHSWRKEILALEIVQDDDDSVPEDEAGRCCERFVEFADLVEEWPKLQSWWHR